MSIETYIGFAVSGVFTGFGVALGTYLYKKFMEPSLERGHEKLVNTPFPTKFPSTPQQEPQQQSQPKPKREMPAVFKALKDEIMNPAYAPRQGPSQNPMLQQSQQPASNSFMQTGQDMNKNQGKDFRW
jgi:hypothetical protein